MLQTAAVHPATLALLRKVMPHVDLFHILKSLTYFADATPEADPKMLIKTTWSTVTKAIAQKTQAYLKSR